MINGATAFSLILDQLAKEQQRSNDRNRKNRIMIFGPKHNRCGMAPQRLSAKLQATKVPERKLQRPKPPAISDPRVG
jgi:hypothetical protein